MEASAENSNAQYDNCEKNVCRNLNRYIFQSVVFVYINPTGMKREAENKDRI